MSICSRCRGSTPVVEEVGTVRIVMSATGQHLVDCTLVICYGSPLLHTETFFASVGSKTGSSHIAGEGLLRTSSAEWSGIKHGFADEHDHVLRLVMSRVYRRPASVSVQGPWLAGLN
jgi:hypothetical protein